MSHSHTATGTQWVECVMPHSQSHSYTVLVRCDVQLTLPQAHNVFVGFGTDAVGGWDKKVKQMLPAWILIDASFLGWVAFSLASTGLAVEVLVWQHKKLWLFLNIPHLWHITALISFVCAWVFMSHTFFFFFFFFFLFSVSFCSQPTKGQIPVRGRTDNNLQAQIRTKQLIGQRKKKELWHLASSSHFPLFVDVAVILVSATLAYF